MILYFFLNGCTHVIHSAKFGVSNNSELDESGTRKVKDFDQRMQIYELLLDQMSDEEKIGVTARLAKHILQSATGSKGNLSQAASTYGGIQDEENLHLWSV